MKTTTYSKWCLAVATINALTLIAPPYKWTDILVFLCLVWLLASWWATRVPSK
jgi:hypothetical protein